MWTAAPWPMLVIQYSIITLYPGRAKSVQCAGKYYGWNILRQPLQRPAVSILSPRVQYVNPRLFHGSN